MDSRRFDGDDESISLIHDEDIDYDDYNTPNTSKVDEASFTMPGSANKETTLWHRWKTLCIRKAATIHKR